MNHGIYHEHEDFRKKKVGPARPEGETGLTPPNVNFVN